MLDPRWIAQTLGVHWTKPIEQPFTTVTIDSRGVLPGALFVGVKTPSGHRQAYTTNAVAAGAAAAIVEELQPIDVPQLIVPDSTAALQKLAEAKRAKYLGKIIGLSGSSGKTTAKELTAHLLGPDTYKTEGNLNNHLGVALTLLHAPLDAPHWVLEAGISTPGEMDALAGMIRPNVAFLTMIGSAHLEFLKTRENIAREKGKLLQALQPKGMTVIHESDLVFEALQNLPGRVIVLCQSKPLGGWHQNYQACAMHLANHAEIWNLQLGGENYTLPLWTPGVARSAALALTVARELGVGQSELQARLHTWPGAQLRGNWQRWTGGQARIYLDAYNSNPEALADSLWRFERMASSAPRHYIIGTMAELGDESDALHRSAMQQVPAHTSARYICIGAQAPLMVDELKKRRLNAEVAESVEKIKSVLASAQGDCFIKGSHSSHLHTLAALCSPL